MRKSACFTAVQHKLIRIFKGLALRKFTLSISEGKGFTLIELLVVISIIGILIALSLAAFQGVRRAARDGKRQSDLKIIQSALEQYRSDQNFYPFEITSGAAITSSTGRPAPTPTPLRTYLSQVPTDPQGAVYIYQASPLSPACNNSSGNYCLNYCLYAAVENTATAADTACPNQPDYNYEVTSP